MADNKGLIIVNITYFIVMLSILLVTFLADKPLEEINCFVLNVTSGSYNNAVIGNYIQTIIRYELHFHDHYHISITNKIFYNGDIEYDNQKFIDKYGKMNTKYACLYKKKDRDYVYMDNLNKNYDKYWSEIFIICMVYIAIVFILIIIFTPRGRGRGFGDDFD